MNLLLKGFSQDVDLSSPDRVLYHFIIQAENGRVIRLPVQKETTDALIQELYASKMQEKEAESTEPSEEIVAEEFGGDYEEELSEEDELPESEEDITSI